MYLKSIEIQGFKSFANKIHFDFHNGITGIVGPNGSGKSNVSDAVRWVFGEQSARQLRGGSMQDVIFAGTQLRKPQSFASVSITLDNADRALSTDTDEVNVTRKLYRSGESEYLLNGKDCRLKDILEIFYDTGIGKEGYSVIGQGQIDRILSVKPEERRELFDEAAGIVRFKRRKAAAEKKLESEQASMYRISDIMAELEKQTGPLFRQSETAKKYLKLRDELKSLDINAFLYDYQSLTEQLAKNDENRENVEKQLQDEQNEEQKLREQYEDLDEFLKDLDVRIEAVRTEMQDSAGKSSDIRARIQVLQEQINTLKNDMRHFESRIGFLDSETVRLSSERKEHENSLQKNCTERAEAKEAMRLRRIETEGAETRVRMLREQLDTEQGKRMDLLNERSGFTARLQHFDTLKTESERRREEAEKQAMRLEERRTAAGESINRLKRDAAEKEKTIGEKREEHENIQRELHQAEAECRESENRINDLMQRFQIQKSRLDTLRNLAERYEGYGSAVRRVMEEKKREKGILGVVADLISTEHKYETAIETALGGSIQNIVTEDEQTAKRMIGLLKESRAGRATFLPLQSIEPRQKPDGRILKEPGIIGYADTLVRSEDRIRPVVRYLLGHFVVADNIDHALSAADKYRHAFRIVTLDGESLSIGGAISGGAYRNASNLLGRTRELESLEQSVIKSRDESNEENRKLNLRKQLRDSLRVELEDLEEELNEDGMKLREIRISLDQRQRELANTDAELQENKTLLQEIEKSVREAEYGKQAALDAMKQLTDRDNESVDSRDQTQKLLSEAEAEREKIAEILNGLQIGIARQDQAEEYLNERISGIIAEIDKYRIEKKELAVQTASSEQEIRNRLSSIEDLRSEMTDTDLISEKQQETLSALTEEHEARADEQRRFFEKRDALNTVIGDLTREQLRLQMQHEKAEERLDGLTEYLWTEYQLTPSEAENFRDDTLKAHTALKREVNELKSQIRALGNVNVNAIEQYKEVSERYEFMKTQYDDLTEAEQKLRGIINDLENGMRHRFTEAFEQIRGEFDTVFRDLFGGGSGTIELDPEADVIDAGITIIAQPPGKKLQNMMQLSGGEKALTAIALIFAIQNLRPAPFCLLDEIEASLDDSNVGRFTDYLKKLSDQIQFIVITHRRGTMTASDRLYGITMQEKGVSTLVSVNLIEEQLDR